MRRGCLLLFLVCCVVRNASADTISGSACYRFSDNESIIEARSAAFSLAVRNAVEKDSYFLSSVTNVKDGMLKEDLITGIALGLTKNTEITDQSEDLDNREICRSIIAKVDRSEMDSLIDEVRKGSLEKIRNQNTGAGIVYDKSNGLMWHKGEDPLRWRLAKTYCEHSELGGYKDWSLPSMEELDLVFLIRKNFPNFYQDYYWASGISAGIAGLPMSSRFGVHFEDGDIERP